MHPARLVLLLGLLLATGAAAEPASLAGFLQQAAGIDDWLISTRRTLHAYPELFYEEHNTSATIRRTLDELGIPYKCAMLWVTPEHACKGNVPLSVPRPPVAAAAPAT